MPKKGSDNLFTTAELRAEHFFANFLQHEGLRSLLICFICLIIVIVIAVIMIRQLYYAPTKPGDGSPEDLKMKRKVYEDILGHIRGLEALRHERELLSKRALRVVQSWQKKDENRTAAPGATAEVVDDLADDIRIMKREHQLLMMNCTAALGERDTAGVFRVDKQNAIWQQAITKAQRDLEKEKNMSAREIEEIEDEEIKEIEKKLK